VDSLTVVDKSPPRQTQNDNSRPTFSIFRLKWQH